MDLSNYNLSQDADDGFEMTIVDPNTGKNTDAVINIIGADSKVYRSIKSKIYRKAAAKDIDADELSAEVYSACITGWAGLQEGGKDIKFTQDAALELLIKLPWLMDQIGLAVETRANFMKKPAES